jgi:hypothetical protein
LLIFLVFSKIRDMPGVERFEDKSIKRIQGEALANFYAPLSVKNLFNAITSEARVNVREGSQQEIMIAYKISHIYEVVGAIDDIITRDREYDFNRIKAYLSAFLHDIGRFPESLRHDQFDMAGASFRHNIHGGEIFLENFPPTEANSPFDTFLKFFGIASYDLHEAIERHSEIEYKGVDENIQLLRDADKLATLRRHDDLCAFHLINTDTSQGLTVLDEFEKNGKVIHAHIKGFADRLTMDLSWMLDLNIGATVDIVLEEGIIQHLLDKFEMAGISPKDKDKILDIFISRWNERYAKKLTKKELLSPPNKTD